VNEPPAFILTDINTFFAAPKNVFKRKKNRNKLHCFVIVVVIVVVVVVTKTRATN
jgi:hypothetical protein